MITAKKLAAFLESKIGTAYVYGMKGEKMSEAKFNELYRLYPPPLVPASDRSKIGKICTDCSGLISWATGVVYSSQMLYDRAVKRMPISTIKDAPIGAVLWRSGHCGVYIGNNMCIEAKGSAYGTVKTPVTGAGANSWTHWLIMDYIKVEEEIDMEELKKLQERVALLEKNTEQSRVKYGYVDDNMPPYAKATIKKLVDKKYLKGDETGNLQLSDEMLRIFVVLDQVGVFGE